jgi:hypothetical protein
MAISTVAWLFLVWMVWKKKTNIFHDQMEPKLAERRLKMLKVFLLVAGLSIATYIGFMLHIVIFRPSDYEGGFFIALFSIMLFLIANISGMVILIKGRRKQAKGIPK